MKKNLAVYVGKHKIVFSVIVVIVVLLVATTLVLPSLNKESIVASEELKGYVEVYLSEYDKLVDENSGVLVRSNLTNWSKFTFFQFHRFNVEGVISRRRGTALFFTPSNGTAKITIKQISDPIEYYIWPQMTRDITNLPMVLISQAEGYYHLTNAVIYDYGLLYVEPGANLRYTGEGHAFNISDEGVIVILGSLIEEHRMILKGSNGKEDWSKLQARFDALSEFIWDCNGVLNETVIESIDAKYKLTLLLEKIALRMKSGEYRDNPGLFTEDYEKLKTVSPPDEILSKILADYIDMQESTIPTLSERILDFFVQTIIGQMILVTVIGGIILAVVISKYIEPATKRRAQKT